MNKELEFIEKIISQCKQLNFYCEAIWQLAPNIFCAHISSAGMENKYIFFLNPQEISIRNPDKITKNGCRLKRVMFRDNYFTMDPSIMAFTIGHVYAEPFVSVTNALASLPLIFMKTKGDEVDWFNEPKEVNIKS
ncbi:MAG: hypothetical protein WC457_04470 [Patescibacteria group bacterium]